MTVTPITSVYGAPAVAETTSGVNALDKEAFLALLVASLRYQDPSEPMDTSDLMAQTTQLSVMEQLTEMAALSKQSFELQQRASAAGLVGRYVTFADGSQTVTGLVSAVKLGQDVPTLVVDGRDVALDDVTAISTTAPTPAASA